MQNFSSAKGLGLLFYEMLHIFFVPVIPTRAYEKKNEKKNIIADPETTFIPKLEQTLQRPSD